MPKVLQCDRCHRILDYQYYEVPFHLKSTDVGTNTLCKPCVDNLKRILVQFWKVRVTEEPTRERIGIGIPESISFIPHNNPGPTLEKLKPNKPKESILKRFWNW